MEELMLIAPGTVLCKAREAKGLSQADIANRLRLTVQMVKAIEADDYAHFAAPVYIRGYLRSYASLLGLDSAALLSIFDQMGLEAEIDQSSRVHYISSNITKIGHLHHSKRCFARWMSQIIIVFLIALVGIWWYGQHHRKQVDVSRVLTGISLRMPKPTTTVSVSAPAPAPAPAPVTVSSVPVAASTPSTTMKTGSGLRETFVLEPKK